MKNVSVKNKQCRWTLGISERIIEKLSNFNPEFTAKIIRFINEYKEYQKATNCCFLSILLEIIAIYIVKLKSLIKFQALLLKGKITIFSKKISEKLEELINSIPVNLPEKLINSIDNILDDIEMENATLSNGKFSKTIEELNLNEERLKEDKLNIISDLLNIGVDRNYIQELFKNGYGKYSLVEISTCDDTQYQRFFRANGYNYIK